mmetsp:Transcript_29632/g.78058  ORF Transcript_29632/g.78058 Transcript_29632/m.78058 type:complete len:102 (+) Transcript_29632:222-527(+)
MSCIFVVGCDITTVLIVMSRRQRSISKRLSSPSPRQVLRKQLNERTVLNFFLQMRIATDRMNAQEHLQIYMASRLYLKYFFNFQDSMSYNQLKLAMPFERG